MTQIASAAAEELLAEEALAKSLAHLKQAKKESKKTKKQQAQRRRQQQQEEEVFVSETYPEWVAESALHQHQHRPASKTQLGKGATPQQHQQQVQHEAQHTQAAQQQMLQSLHAAQSAAVAELAHPGQQPVHLHEAFSARQAQHAKQAQRDARNLLHGITHQLADQLVMQPSDEAQSSAQMALQTGSELPSNTVAADASALFLCPLTKVIMSCDSSIVL